MTPLRSTPARTLCLAAVTLATMPVSVAGAARTTAAQPTKPLTSPAPSKHHAAQPGSDQPFLNAVQHLVNDGAITPAEGNSLISEIESGRIDSSALPADGLTSSQVQAVQQALTTTKESLAAHPQLVSK